MSDLLKPLSIGDPLPTSIRTWNPMLKAARQAQQAPLPQVRPPKWPTAVGVVMAQAPVDGIPARVGATPGIAVCTQVIHAPQAGSGFSVGDLVKTSKTFNVKNNSFSVHGAEGDRIIWVSTHDDNSILVGSECDNEGNPSSILLYEPT